MDEADQEKVKQEVAKNVSELKSGCGLMGVGILGLLIFLLMRSCL